MFQVQPENPCEKCSLRETLMNNKELLKILKMRKQETIDSESFYYSLFYYNWCQNSSFINPIFALFLFQNNEFFIQKIFESGYSFFEKLNIRHISIKNLVKMIENNI